jgi:hypothetical protein
MNKLTVTLLIIIAILIGVIIITSGNSNEEDKYAVEKQRIDSLSKAIVILEKEQKVQDSLIVLYKDSLIIADKQIDSTKYRIKEIQNYYGNKIKNLTNATHTELSDFFTERYR